MPIIGVQFPVGAPKANIVQLAEHRLPKPNVAGSNPAVRSVLLRLHMVFLFSHLEFTPRTALLFQGHIEFL